MFLQKPSKFAVSLVNGAPRTGPVSVKLIRPGKTTYDTDWMVVIIQNGRVIGSDYNMTEVQVEKARLLANQRRCLCIVRKTGYLHATDNPLHTWRMDSQFPDFW